MVAPFARGRSCEGGKRRSERPLVAAGLNDSCLRDRTLVLDLRSERAHCALAQLFESTFLVEDVCPAEAADRLLKLFGDKSGRDDDGDVVADRANLSSQLQAIH